MLHKGLQTGKRVHLKRQPSLQYLHPSSCHNMLAAFQHTALENSTPVSRHLGCLRGWLEGLTVEQGTMLGV